MYKSSFVPVNVPLVNGNEKKYLDECISSGWISSEGPFVKQFEAQFATRVKRKHAIAVTSGTAALDVAVEALGIGPGTFTGIRVGLSLAQGIAFSIGIPILPINIMDVLNEQVKASDIYIIAVHSHKEYVFCKKFNTIKNEKIKLKSIAQMGYDEDIYGIDLEHSQINFNYHSLKLSSREIGKYGLKNYKILAKNNIASIKPIYLNEYKIDYKV